MTELLNADALRLARESRGHSQIDVAKAAGVTQGLISKAERGAVPLKPEIVQAIAGFLRYPAEFFYEDGRVTPVRSPCRYHRKRKTLPAKVLNKIDAQMNVRNVHMRHLFSGLDVEGDREFHTLDLDEYGSSPEAVAQALRTAWRVPDGPIPNLTSLVESAGGVVLMEKFDTHKFFGMSCWTTLDRPLFFLNADAPTEVMRWTMAHELGHLTMHASPCDGDPEEQADAFAAEFLAPARLLKPTLRKLRFDRLPQLKAYWRLSMKALITRASQLGAIDNLTSQRLYKQYSARRYNAGEPYQLSPEPPTLVDAAIRVHLGEHDYTVEELARAIRIDSDEFQRTFMGEGGEQPKGKVVSLQDLRSRHRA